MYIGQRFRVRSKIELSSLAIGGAGGSWYAIVCRLAGRSSTSKSGVRKTHCSTSAVGSLYEVWSPVDEVQIF